MGVTYTIGTLASLTGLSPHTIRAWERRYRSLSPGRTETNRRVYGTKDVERLTLLKRAVESGHSIGQVAHLPTEQLQTLGIASPSVPATTKLALRSEGFPPFLNDCLGALDRLDPVAFEEGLVRGTAALGIMGLLEGVVIPALSDIETRWISGSIGISQEHMASAVLRTYLDRVRTTIQPTDSAPRILVTTPRNQFHEIGALMVSVVAAMHSWSVNYLGPNLPANDIASAARQCGARAIGLSLVYPLDDRDLPGELQTLRHQLGASMPILVGGRAIDSYSGTLSEIGAHVLRDFNDLCEDLDSIAHSGPSRR